MPSSTNTAKLNPVFFTHQEGINLVGGLFFQKTFNDSVIVIPSYLGVSQFIISTLTRNDTLLTNHIMAESIREKASYFLTWASQLTSSIDKLRKSTTSITTDMKSQLRAVGQLRNALDGPEHSSSSDSQSILSYVLAFSHRKGWIQYKEDQGKTIYYFSHSVEPINGLNRDLAIECFSLLIASQLIPCKLRKEIHTLLKEKKCFKPAPLDSSSQLSSSSTDSSTKEIKTKHHKLLDFIDSKQGKSSPLTVSPTSITGTNDNRLTNDTPR